MLYAAHKESKIVVTDWIDETSSLLCRDGYTNVFATIKVSRLSNLFKNNPQDLVS